MKMETNMKYGRNKEICERTPCTTCLNAEHQQYTLKDGFLKQKSLCLGSLDTAKETEGSTAALYLPRSMRCRGERAYHSTGSYSSQNQKVEMRARIFIYSWDPLKTIESESLQMCISLRKAMTDSYPSELRQGTGRFDRCLSPWN